MFRLENVNDDDIKRKYQEIVQNLKEDQKTDIIFNGENLYDIGGGHDFIYSFYREYITKSGSIAIHYLYKNYWVVNGKEYKIEKNNFIEIIRESRNLNPISMEVIKFPIIKTAPNLISNDIIPITPKTPPYPKVD